MKLEVGHIFINDIQFASESKIENGVLYVDEEAVKAIVLEDEKKRLAEKCRTQCRSGFTEKNYHRGK